MQKWLPAFAAAIIVGSVALESAPDALGQYYTPQNAQFNRYYYYPYYYFPHNYWPVTGQHWPERPGEPYQKPPAYMAYPPFREQNWRYELYMPQKYYRGQHFFLDQF